MKILKVQNLGPIKEADITFGDLTLFVGPQASGKSILLQMLKLAVDRNNISTVLKNNNYSWGRNADTYLESFFGESMSGIWTSKTKIELDGKQMQQATLVGRQGRRPSDTGERLFYIPAQRIVTMSQGWPRNFGSFDIGDPFVLKQFSETVRVLMEKENIGTSSKESKVFPKPNRIKEPLRRIIDDAIFHGAAVQSDNTSLKRRFVLEIGASKLPFMTWSAGQKEFMLMLLSLYHLMPSSKVKTKDGIKYVIIEEPEMGLHPNAIKALMVIFLELIARGYKVLVATHSPVFLELLWALKYIKTNNGQEQDLFDLFDIRNNTSNVSIKTTFHSVIKNKQFSTYYFDQAKEGVVVKNISSLDADSEDEAESNWGGLTQFASKASDIVSRLNSCN
jgi:energy-coupling factor transporter ATP-binding protein EcfA2